MLVHELILTQSWINQIQEIIKFDLANKLVVTKVLIWISTGWMRILFVFISNRGGWLRLTKKRRDMVQGYKMEQILVQDEWRNLYQEVVQVLEQKLWKKRVPGLDLELYQVRGQQLALLKDQTLIQKMTRTDLENRSTTVTGVSSEAEIKSNSGTWMSIVTGTAKIDTGSPSGTGQRI